MSNKTSLKRAKKKKALARSLGKSKQRPSGTGGATKKMKRKAFSVARKQFFKDFKTQMANFKKQVKCSACGRVPREGENIDDWHINKESENIDLICTDCYTPEQEQGDV